MDIALAVGAEKMNVADRDRTMAVFEGAYDVSDPAAWRPTPTTPGGDDDGRAGRRSVFMDIYAAWARAHTDRFGTTRRQLAAVAAKNHKHAVHNGKAHYQREFSIEEVLAGRPLPYPLTVPMCAPVTDGASAAVVCGERGLGRLGTGRGRAVRVLASVLGTGVAHSPDAWDLHIGRLVARRAYERAGVGPGDIDVAEVHDATAIGEIQQTEFLGLCAPGAGGPAAERGDTALGGRVPVNPSGGLESKGHPLGATGLAQVYELVRQLRGECGARQVPGARIAVAENSGGFYGGDEAVAAITILGA